MIYEDIINIDGESMNAEEPMYAGSISQLREAVISRVNLSTNKDELYQCLSILDDASMPCSIQEEDIDSEIELAMNSGNATQAEVNRVFSRC